MTCDPQPMATDPPLSLAFHLSLNSPPRDTFIQPSPSPFECLPHELLEQIATELCRTTPLGPPTALLPLLLVSRRFNFVLGVTNEGFYSDLFKERFDWRSVERRWGFMKKIEDKREKREVLDGGVFEARPDTDLKLAYHSFTRPSSPSEMRTSTSPWRPLTSKDYATEFKRRCVVLTKMRTAAISGIPPNTSRPGSPRLQPLSSSGSYKTPLNEPDDLTQNLWTCYLMLSENDGKNVHHLLEYADLRTYTKLFYKHSLLSDAVKPGWPRESAGRGLGLWISWFGGDDISKETFQESDEREFVLKPYVFGAHRFDAFYAPWTIPQLPVTPATHPLGQPPLDPFTADLRPKTQAQSIIHMGRRIELAPPILSHAAIFSFFYRIEHDPESAAQLSLMGQLTAVNFPHAPPPGVNRPPTTIPVIKAAKTLLPVLESKLHDRDFFRLASCFDPYSSLGLPTLYSGPELTGSWEGRFSFFDFDSYRDMLGGRMRSLYEGPFGDQPQVWKLEMKVVRVTPGSQKGGSGPVLNAGFDLGSSLGAASTSARMSTSPTGRSFFDGFAAGRASSSALPGGRRSSVDGPGDWFEGDGLARLNKRRRSVQDDTPFNDDEDEEEKLMNDGEYETILSGSGHSSWGQFVLRGRVRAWDGLFSIIKEYSSDNTGPRENRGRWLYRGYCVGGNSLVGRWRDTHTPQSLNGYEGTWCMQRRQE